MLKEKNSVTITEESNPYLNLGNLIEKNTKGLIGFKRFFCSLTFFSQLSTVLDTV